VRKTPWFSRVPVIVLALLVSGASLVLATGTPAAASGPGGACVLNSGTGVTTCTFSETDAEQTFVVPANVTAVHITALGAGTRSVGASPGFTSAIPGSKGALVSGDFSVSPGLPLYVEVGGLGTYCGGPGNDSGHPPTPGGWNGGGDGNCSGSGGGASDVRTISMADAGTLGSRLIVAGGGGGGGGGVCGAGGGPFHCQTGGTGGDAGGTGGLGTGTSPGTAGQAGTQTAGGIAGTPGGSAGSLGQGGAGPSGGGGGGGGYYGGGSGGGLNGDTGGNGGGGGSSLVPPGGSATLGTADTPGGVTISFTAGPVAAPTQSPAPNAAGWNNTDVTVNWNWTAADPNSIDSTDCTTSSTSSGEGLIPLSATCFDVAGNEGTASTTVKVDKTPPADNPVVTGTAGSNGWYLSDVAVAWNWTDAGSGIDPANCTQNNSTSGEGTAITVSSTCYDLAGNSASDSRTFKINNTPMVLSPSSLPNPTWDQPYSTAITASGGVSPVTFVVSSGTLPTGLSLASNGVLSGTATGKAQIGEQFSFAVTATAFSGNSVTQSYTMTAQSPPTLKSSANPSVIGQPVTFKANVTSTGGAPSGNVQFTVDGTNLGAPVALSSGSATSPATSSLSPGAHTVTANYLGSTGLAASSVSLTQVVTRTPCATLAGCNLQGLNLSGANLAGANLSKANLTGANLAGANLSGAVLNQTNLTGANLAGANLSGAVLNQTNLTGANLAGANLSGAVLNLAKLTNANLRGAIATGATFNQVTWSNTTCPDGTNSNSHKATCVGHL
jgi:hypothetical protein